MDLDLLSVILILLVGRTLGIVFTRIKLHSIIGEVLAGVLLGLLLASIVHPTGTLEIFSSFGILMLMLLAGLITDFDSFARYKTSSIVVGGMGVVATFALVLFPMYLINTRLLGFDSYPGFISAVFVAVILSNTAIEVSAKLLMKCKRSRVRTVIMGAAFVDDIIAVFLIGIVSSVALLDSTVSITMTIWLAVKVILFLVFSFWLAIPILEKVFDKFTSIGYKQEDFPLTATIILTFLFAIFARQVGVHEVIGAYIAGLIIGKWGSKVDPMLKRRRIREKLIDDIDPPLRAIFSPLFFGYIGVLFASQVIGIGVGPFFIFLVVILTFLAIAGKVIGCGFGAILTGFKGKRALIIGVGMGGRGALEFVLINYGLEAGIITEQQFIALVVVTLLSIILTPVLYMMVSKDVPGE